MTLKRKAIKHKLLDYQNQVEKTHTGLGSLYVFSLLCVKASKALVVVAPAGTGKSSTIAAAAQINPAGVIEAGSLTRSGIPKASMNLNDSTRTILTDDLGEVDTKYSALETLKTAVHLIHEHKISKYNSTTQLNISNFHGSFLTTIQPSKLQEIVGSNSWEAVIRDKMIRYYHMIRPIKPTLVPIKVKAKWGTDMKKVSDKLPKSEFYPILEEVAYAQWSKSRGKQHLTDLLKACAALDGRVKIMTKDIELLWYLMQPMRLEQYLFVKHGLESEIFFQNDHMCILSELASYEKLTIRDIMNDFHISQHNAKDIVFKLDDIVMCEPQEPYKILPTETARRILLECGFI